MTAQEHNRLISILFHIQGGLQVLVGIFLALLYAGMGSYFMLGLPQEEARFMGGMFIVIGIVVAAVVLLFAVLDFYAAFKIGKVQPIGRTLGIVLSILSLMSFPLGTAMGIYGLWFFFGDNGKMLYGLAGSPDVKYSPPPPPNSWQ